MEINVWLYGGYKNDYIVSVHRTIYIRDSSTHNDIRKLQGHTHSVTCIDTNNDIIASGSWDHTIRIWHGYSGVCLHTLQGNHNSRIHSIHLYAQHYIVSVCDDCVCVHDLRTYQCLYVFATHLNGAYGLNDETLIFFTNKAVDRVDPVSCKQVCTYLDANISDINKVCAYTELGYLITLSFDANIRIWNVDTGTLIKIINDSSGFQICILRHYIVISGFDHIDIYNLLTFSKYNLYTPHHSDQVYQTYVCGDYIIYQEAKGINRMKIPYADDHVLLMSLFQ